ILAAPDVPAPDMSSSSVQFANSDVPAEALAKVNYGAAEPAEPPRIAEAPAVSAHERSKARPSENAMNAMAMSHRRSDPDHQSDPQPSPPAFDRLTAPF